MPSGYDQTKIYMRMFPGKDWEVSRFAREDFKGVALNTFEWNLTLSGTGSGVLQNNRPNGVYRMSTGAVLNDYVILNKNNIRIVDPSLFPLIGFRAKMVSVANDNIEMRLGYMDVFDTDHCIFQVDRSGYGNLSIYGEVYKNGSQVRSLDTGIDLNANWHIYEIFINSAGRPFWKIDGVYEAEGQDADVDVAEFFEPHAEIKTQDANAKLFELDFIEGMQKRE